VTSSGSDRSSSTRAPASARRRSFVVRRAKPEDIPGIVACQRAAYPTLPAASLCDDRQLTMQLAAFPEGQLVALRQGVVIGYAASLIVQLEDDSPWYSYGEITGDGTFSTHDPSGDTLYGADIAVHPDYRGQGVAQQLYVARKRLLKRLNLRRMVAGGRIPGYRAQSGSMTAEEYVRKVVAGELRDPSLSVHLRAGYHVRAVHMGYMRDDQSLNYATFLEMQNADHRPTRRRIAASPLKRTVRRIRVCAAQYEMRRVATWDEFQHQVQFFVSTAEEYHCHFLLFPELFTAQLFSLLDPALSGPEAIGQLADMTDRYRAMFVEMAKRSGLYIIGGTQPVRVGTGIRNVAHLFTPNGEIHTQDKLHVTPNERQEYGIQPGDDLRIFDTPYGRIGILVCYDVEFPELARLLTFAGLEVLFVPFSTDERKAYLRVSYTGRARAVENVIYVVMAGNVGNLPQVDNFLINYGHAVVCTPSDFMFPPDATAGKAEFNTETVVVCDLDLGALEQAREIGSVRLLRDRRSDLYTVESRRSIETIRTT